MPRAPRRATPSNAPAARKSPARPRAQRAPATSAGWARAVAHARTLLERRGCEPTPVQRAAFDALPTREDLLLVAPTGTGKTHAVLLPMLCALADRTLDAPYGPRDAEAPTGVRVLYLSPLRALAQQQFETLALDARDVADLIEGAHTPRVAARTGDTQRDERRSLAKSPPDVLVLTPESLAIVLATGAREALARVTEVVLDEVHALAGGKRGALLAATLETLGHFLSTRGTPRPRRVALTATAHPEEALARWIAGSHGPAARVLVAEPARAPRVELLVPGFDEPFPPPGWTSRRLLPSVARSIASCDGTSMLFAPSRPRVEHWTQALRDVLPPRMPVACFHGSMSAEERGFVRTRLALGELRVIVSTSSLEAGVDLPSASQVLMLGAPATVTQLVQTAGRSAHRPGETPLARLVPADACELLACVAARQCCHAHALEPVELRTHDLDVAVQAALSLCALGEPITREQLEHALRSAAPFARLSPGEVRRILEHLCTGGDALAAYDEARRIERRDDDTYVLASAQSRTAYLRGVGTIVDEPAVTVRAQGRPVGTLDGRFAALLEPGDPFALAGSVWRVVSRAPDAIEATRARDHRGAPPRWSGPRQARSAVVAARIEQLLGLLDETLGSAPSPEEDRARVCALLALEGREEPAADALVALVRAQRAASRVPSPSRLVVEVLRARGRSHLVLHTFAGASANEVLGRALARRWSRDVDPSLSAESSLDGVEIACTDEGLVLAVPRVPRENDALERTLRALLTPRDLYEDSVHTLDGSALARSHFREVARVAQLTPASNRPGAASPALLYDVLRKHAPQSLLLDALAHTLWSALDGARAEAFLRALPARTLHVVRCDRVSPLAIPVFARGEARRDRLAPDDLEGALTEAAHALYLRAGGDAAMP